MTVVMRVDIIRLPGSDIQRSPIAERRVMFIKTKDGVEIFYKDWGHGQPIVFHHGWPLSSDDWDTQMLFFIHHGYRVIGIDRRGHGRSSQVSDGHDMDHYAADAAAITEHLDLRNAVHIGHSTGGGEVTRYVARHGKGRVAKAVLMSAVPPIMVKSPNNPDGLPISVFDELRKSLAANRAQFYHDFASKPFYGFNRPGAKPLDGVIGNWWRQGMMGGAKAHYDGIKAFSETDLTEDLKSIDVPTLVCPPPLRRAAGATSTLNERENVRVDRSRLRGRHAALSPRSHPLMNSKRSLLIVSE
jgi:non-heme chloroperoxidase